MARLLYRFGDCSVDPAARELRRSGALVILSPKVFDCLAYLIDHRDRAVGRDELIAAVWSRIDVTDSLLGQAVLKARRAVGDTGDEQNAIRTVPRFGYRWVADVDVEERADPPRTQVDAQITLPAIDGNASADADGNAGSTAGEGAASIARVGSGRRKAIAWSAAALALLAMITAALLAYRREAPPPATAAQAGADVIAVLPVVVEAGPEWSWLRLGLMGLAADRLHGAGLAVVPSDNVVALLRTAGTDATAVAKTVRAVTGARRLLSGKATRAAADWRVRFELRGDGGDIDVESHHADAVAATRAAIAKLLARLGKPSAPDGAAAQPNLEEIQQRAEAALLTDDLDGARRVIGSAPENLRHSPELRLRLAQVDLRAGQSAAARQRLDQLLADLPAEADPVLRARALTTISSAAIHTGDLAEAARACAKAIALFGNRNEPAGIGRAYTACGVANASAGRFDAAMNDFAQARVALEITGDALSLARVEANEGLMENKRGRYAESLAIMRRSEERFRHFGGRIEMIQAINDQVDAHLALLQPVEALAASERGWALLPQIENAEIRHFLQVQHARALAGSGRIGEAAALLTMIANEAAPGQELSVLGQTRATQARIELATGRAQAAGEHAREALVALANPDDARERAMAWLTLVRALRAAKLEADASSETRRFVAWSAASTTAAASVYAALADAELHWASQRDVAMASYERALAAAASAGVPAEVSAVAVSWGDALIDAGDLQRASAVIGRVARWAETDFACSVVQARLYRALDREDAWRTALQRARALAGERPIPASATESAPRLSAPSAPVP